MKKIKLFVLCAAVICSGLPGWLYAFEEPGGEISLNREKLSLSGAVEQAENRKVTILVDQPVALTGPVSIPENIQLKILYGNIIYLDNFNLEIKGMIDAGAYQIFDTLTDYNKDKVTGGKVVGNPRVSRVMPQWWGVEKSGGDSNAAYAIQEALNLFNVVYLPPGLYEVDKTIKFAGNGQLLYGENGVLFGADHTVIKAVKGFAGDCIVDMNENPDPKGYGGQFNHVRDIFFLGSSDFGKDDPVGIKFERTRDSLRITGCSFRKLKMAFKGSGWIHFISECFIYQCYSGFEIHSTSSSVLDKIHLQTTYASWGILGRASLQNSTIQQGTEHERLQEDKGIVCLGRCSIFNTYFEGGNAQVYVSEEASVNMSDCHFGYTTRGLGRNYKFFLENEGSLFLDSCSFHRLSNYLFAKAQGKVDSIVITHSDVSHFKNRFFRSSRDQNEVRHWEVN